jgi:hypothetical protein
MRIDASSSSTIVHVRCVLHELRGYFRIYGYRGTFRSNFSQYSTGVGAEVRETSW